MKLYGKLLKTDGPPIVILVRLFVGTIFISEGLQKFLYTMELGAGRFAKIGIPYPNVMAPFVGVVEVTCGALLLLGLFTRLAAVPLIITMLVAIISTKIPILLGYGFWGFRLGAVPSYGFWSMAHEMRTDWALLLGSTFLLIIGAGKWSVDACLASKKGA